MPQGWREQVSRLQAAASSEKTASHAPSYYSATLLLYYFTTLPLHYCTTLLLYTCRLQHRAREPPLRRRLRAGTHARLRERGRIVGPRLFRRLERGTGVGGRGGVVWCCVRDAAPPEEPGARVPGGATLLLYFLTILLLYYCTTLLWTACGRVGWVRRLFLLCTTVGMLMLLCYCRYAIIALCSATTIDTLLLLCYYCGYATIALLPLSIRYYCSATTVDIIRYDYYRLLSMFLAICCDHKTSVDTLLYYILYTLYVDTLLRSCYYYATVDTQ